jgi:hypothetical protein
LSRIRILRIAVVAMLAAFMLMGCGKKQVVKPSDEAVAASRAVGVFMGMERAYRLRDAAGVTGPVSPDFRPGYSEFLSGIRKDMEAFTKVNLEVETERVYEAGEDVKVVFHWRGVWLDRSGRENEGRGNAVFVFRETGGQMSLYDVLGDSPFGVTR